ncbi:hypothetical protein I302_102066 [Kwoniella bestiolae CBS 10118]|uniref:Protein CPL1-like domain-containing protein n=1 Tax=Kwoniella bestiolae CBS 10118 TaxID=1296100 RepID=A0A1B9GE45_9TREE|nr:hypothetical protein I302_00751 [Kwoniella bestiolae CBS 10118]OCF29255.1 hypothetical protein I302_00751 [Kwoniella bestiolae CBS 10118]
MFARADLTLLSLISLLGVVKAASFIGCVDPYRLRDYPVVLASDNEAGVIDQSSCLTYCKTENYRTGAYDTVTDVCYCTSDIPPFSPYYLDSSADSAGNCVAGSGDVQVFDLQTPFQFLGCYDNDPDDAVYIDYIDFESCFDRCSASGSNYNYAFPQTFTVGSGRNSICRCGSSPALDSTACGVNARFLYTQNLVVPSGIPGRKRALERLDRARRLARDQPFCPVGMTPCRVEGDSYECVDLNSELESCGGCMNGIYGSDNTTRAGLDCSTLPGAAFGATTCYRGSCQAWACEEGYALEDGVCVRV